MSKVGGSGHSHHASHISHHHHESKTDKTHGGEKKDHDSKLGTDKADSKHKHGGPHSAYADAADATKHKSGAEESKKKKGKEEDDDFDLDDDNDENPFSSLLGKNDDDDDDLSTKVGKAGGEAIVDGSKWVFDKLTGKPDGTPQPPQGLPPIPGFPTGN